MPSTETGEGAPLFALLLTFVVVAAILPTIARPLGTRSFYVATVPFVAALAWGAWKSGEVADGGAVTEQVRWVPALGLELSLRFTGFSLLMLCLVAGIGVLVCVYARSYFSPGPKAVRTASLLVAFGGAMFGLVVADNVFALFMFWELTSVCSFLLIGTDVERSRARSAAMQALLVTGAGGLAMLGGFVLLAQAAGSASISTIVSHPPSGSTVSVALVLILMGALTKSAQVPFHAWLPGAMAVPTPTSAYLHSATMVKAGVYLIALLAPAFAGVGWWRPIVLTAGAASMLIGGYRALRQHDLKLLLAYGTVSQLGFMVILFGVGTPSATFAGCILLLAHGTFKAALFMVVGVIDHQTHTRDLRQLTGLARRWPVVFGTAAVAAASMAGIPPTLGFVAKEGGLSALGEAGTPAGGLLLAVVVVGSIFTVAYSARFVWGAFGPAEVDPLSFRRVLGPDARHPATRFVVPAIVLSALTLVAGVFTPLVAGIVDDAAGALWAEPPHEHVALWHGFGVPLGLSAIVLLAGGLLFLVRRQVERAQAAVPDLPSAEKGYEVSLGSVLRVADVVTGFTQSGSLPTYLAIILATMVLLPTVALLHDPVWPSLDFADSPLQVVIGIIMVTSAVAAARSSRRFSAVLLVGAVGYGMAALFIIQGAPDLAVTQLLIETLGVVIFVMVIRHLPSHFPERPRTAAFRRSQIGKVALAAAVGVFVFVFALLAVGARQVPPISQEYMDRTLPEAGGRNVVNVIVVDFRGFDTMGEITVLAVAALGVAAIVGAGRRRPGSAPDDPTDDPTDEPTDPDAELDEDREVRS